MLRFPCVQKIRYDKNWYECMRYSEISSLKITGAARKKASNVAFGEANKPSKKPRTEQAEKSSAIIDRGVSMKVDLSKVLVKSDVLRGLGRRFYVTPGIYTWRDGKETTHDNVLELVKAHGGTINTKTRSASDLLIAGRYAVGDVQIEIGNVFNQNKVDVLDLSYLLDVIFEGHKGPPLFGHYLVLSESTNAAMADKLGEYADHMSQDTNVHLLQASLKIAAKKLSSTAAGAEGTTRTLGVKKKKAAKAFLSQDADSSLVLNLPFEGAKLYFVLTPEFEREMRFLQMQVRLRGSQVLTEFGQSVTHIIVPEDPTHVCKDQLAKLHEQIKDWRYESAKETGGFKDPRFVYSAWVQMIIDDENRVWQQGGEEKYVVHV